MSETFVHEKYITIYRYISRYIYVYFDGYKAIYDPQYDINGDTLESR